MHDAAIESILAIEWSVAGRPLAGESVSGDTHVVVPTANGVTIAVADALGHGPEAAFAAEIAAATVEAHAADPVADIVTRCHEALRRTRGVAMNIASFDTTHDAMTWTGVGNVEGLLSRRSPTARPRTEALLLRGGVVGYSMPRPRAATLSLSPGDMLIFATDGIHSAFRHGLKLHGSTQDVAADILLNYGRKTDDALVLVARYAGAS